MMIEPADLIAQFWPSHVDCLDNYGDAQADATEGIICSCGTALGFPEEEPPTLSAAEQRYAEALASGAPDDVATAGLAETRASAGPAGSAPATQRTSRTMADFRDAADPVKPDDPINTRLQVIDPTMPYTPDMVEQQMVELERRLEQGQHFQRQWEERVADLTVQYELAFAKALIRQEGGDVGRRRAMALVECEAMFRDKEISDMMLKATRACMHNLRSQLNGYQSIAKSVQASMRAPGPY